MALVIWIGKKHMDQDEKKHAEAQARLHILETERVKPDELVRVESQLGVLTQQMADNHSEILNTIINVSLGLNPLKRPET